jgi:tripartite-type tricarboxylate transporter receptor subunit TctC
VFNDFEPVSLIATNPQIIVARKTLPAKDLKELIAWLKANVATATQGTAGHGSGSHVSGVYFQRRVQLVTATPLVVYRQEFRIPRSSVDVD